MTKPNYSWNQTRLISTRPFQSTSKTRSTLLRVSLFDISLTIAGQNLIMYSPRGTWSSGEHRWQWRSQGWSQQKNEFLVISLRNLLFQFQAAYRTYKKLPFSEKQCIPGFNLTSDQLFWVNSWYKFHPIGFLIFLFHSWGMLSPSVLIIWIGPILISLSTQR